MRSRIRTGDVIQIRQNGPNYIALGKTRNNEGEEFIVATKNGNVTRGGQFKRGDAICKPKIHVLSGSAIVKVHTNRHVDVPSVISRDRTCRQHLHATNSRDGVITEAPNIMAQIRELAAGI